MKSTLKSTIESYYRFWFGLNEIYSMWAKQHGLTVNTLFVLYAVKNIENCTQQKITELLVLPKQTVNSLLQNLEQQGYINKEQHIADKRSKLIVLTPTGSKFTEDLLTKLNNVESEVLRQMTTEELDGFNIGMDSFLKNFKKITKF